MPTDDLLQEVKALRADIEALPGKIADAIETKNRHFLWWAFKIYCFCALVYTTIWAMDKWIFKRD
jgi:hypothetical protein